MGSEQSLPVAAFSLGDSPVQLRGQSVKPFMLTKSFMQVVRRSIMLLTEACCHGSIPRSLSLKASGICLLLRVRCTDKLFRRVFRGVLAACSACCSKEPLDAYHTSIVVGQACSASAFFRQQLLLCLNPSGGVFVQWPGNPGTPAACGVYLWGHAATSVQQPLSSP